MTAKNKKAEAETKVYSDEELMALVKMPSANEVATLKHQHGELFGITVLPSDPDANDGAYFVFKKTNRTILKAASAAKSDLDAADVVLKNCLVWGDGKLLEDMNVFQSVSLQFQEINKPRVSQIKKL